MTITRSAHRGKWNITPPQADISVISTLVTNCNHAWSQGNYNFYLGQISFVFCGIYQIKYQLAFTQEKCLPWWCNSGTQTNRVSLNTALVVFLLSHSFKTRKIYVYLLFLSATAHSLSYSLLCKALTYRFRSLFTSEQVTNWHVPKKIGRWHIALITSEWATNWPMLSPNQLVVSTLL